MSGMRGLDSRFLNEIRHLNGKRQPWEYRGRGLLLKRNVSTGRYVCRYILYEIKCDFPIKCAYR